MKTESLVDRKAKSLVIPNHSDCLLDLSFTSQCSQWRTMYSTYVQLFQLLAVCDANYMSFNYAAIEFQAGWTIKF